MAIYDLQHYYGQDLELSSTGGLETATGGYLTDQTVIRFILTNPGDDPNNPTFGLGASQMIGEADAVTRTKALILKGLKTLDVIDQTSPITAQVFYDPEYTLTARITYTDASTGLTISQTIPIG